LGGALNRLAISADCPPYAIDPALWLRKRFEGRCSMLLIDQAAR
jgi:hypothetical protein